MKIDCGIIADKIYEEIKQNIATIKQKGIQPKIAIIRSNDDPASLKYVNIKLKKAAELGVEVQLITNIHTNEEMISTIKKINEDDSIHGYLVQTPMYPNIDQNLIFQYINVDKDLDGLGPLAIFKNYINSNTYYPIACTSNGIIKILKSINEDLSGKHVVIINRSNIVGKPLIHLLLKENCTVTICHSKTKNLKTITNMADITIIGIGKKHFFNEAYFKPNSIVIDVGINVENNKLYGDANLDDNSKGILYTPVPGGVGKLTVAMIFYNLVNLILKDK